jgi:hypothetical protein
MLGAGTPFSGAEIGDTFSTALQILDAIYIRLVCTRRSLKLLAV